MIERHFSDDVRQSSATYSECGTYRYALTRTWDPKGKRLLYVMLNPSRATERQNDPTIERCERRARALGYGAFCACNIFALRETDPKKLRVHSAPEGSENGIALRQARDWADDILCAWGVHGEHLDQGDKVANLLQSQPEPLLSLGETRQGHPRHPLYVSYAQKPRPWQRTS